MSASCRRFFDTIHQDPTLAEVKLIAEPWDVGEGGYQVGNFPVLWAEWNGKYRDTVRRFWKGDEWPALRFRLSAHRVAATCTRFDGRKPYASINFITAHDGFTLCDLVSYNQKHNEANGDNNKDGADNNDSWNMGVEGPTDDPEHQRAARAADAQLPGDADVLAGRAHADGGDEIGAIAAAATTTPTARTTSWHGSTGS